MAAVVVPGIASAAQARARVAATRFAPEGTRGACPCVRAGDHFIRVWPGHAARQRESVGMIALVETLAGLEAIEEVCEVEGLLALLIGPFDLSVSLGLSGDYLHAEARAAIDRMLAAAQANCVPVMAPCSIPTQSKPAASATIGSGVGQRCSLSTPTKSSLPMLCRATPPHYDRCRMNYRRFTGSLWPCRSAA